MAEAFRIQIRRKREGHPPMRFPREGHPPMRFPREGHPPMRFPVESKRRQIAMRVDKIRILPGQKK